MNAILSQLLNKYFSFEKLLRAYVKVRQGKKKYKAAAIRFRRYDMVYLVNLWNDIKKERYKPGGFYKFWVYEPKKRLINAPMFRDKIVQFALHQALCDIYESIYIKPSYSCLTERGPHRCAKKIQSNIRKCKRNYNDAWIIKLDVEKYFYSIDRMILKKLVRKKIKDKGLLRIIDVVVNSSPEGETGIPLGNVSSQDLANIYLNELDQYVVRYLGCKYYCRFMDDVALILSNRKKAKKVLNQIKIFLNKKLNLNTNQKTHIFPLKQGVNSCGYKIFATHMLLRDKSKSGMKRRIKAMDRKIKKGSIKVKEVQQSIDSWIGHAMHAESYNLCKKIFNPYDYIELKEELLCMQK